MAQQSLYNEFMEIPIITRIYTTACVITTLLVQLDVVSPFQIYFNHELILNRFQLWRLFTSFFFFGYVGFNFLFNMIFMYLCYDEIRYRYSRMLEEGSFRGRTADFAYMFIIGGLSTAICGCFTQLFFLGQALTLMFVYVWSRRNPFIHLNFLGILTFKAPYLPWVLLGFSLLLGGSVVVDLVGIAVGHVYYFLEDVFPNQPGGRRLLETPSLLKWIFEGTVDPTYAVPPNERPGGFNWGNRENQNDQQPVD